MTTLAVACPHQAKPTLHYDVSFTGEDRAEANEAMQLLAEYFQQKNLMFCYYRICCEYPVYAFYLNTLGRQELRKAIRDNIFESLHLRLGLKDNRAESFDQR